MVPRVMSLPAAAADGCEGVPRTLGQLTRDMKRLRDDAWTEIHDRYFSRLFHYALTLHGGDRAAAEDSVQAGYLRAVRHVRRFDSEDAFWSWLTLLVRCAAADQGRKFAARSRLHDRLLAEVEDPGRSPATPVSSDHRFVLLEEAVTRLGESDRLLLEEKYTEEQSTSQLATGRNVSKKAIECRLRRLRHQLKSTIHALSRQTRL